MMEFLFPKIRDAIYEGYFPCLKFDDLHCPQYFAIYVDSFVLTSHHICLQPTHVLREVGGNTKVFVFMSDEVEINCDTYRPFLKWQ